MPANNITNPKPLQLCPCSQVDDAIAQRDAARADLEQSEGRRAVLFERVEDLLLAGTKVRNALAQAVDLIEEQRDKLQHVELVLAAGDRLAHVASGESILYADLLNAVEAWKAVRR